MKLSIPFPKKFHISGETLFLFWFKRSRKFFVALFFASVVMGGYVWYENVLHGRWSEDQKAQYAATAFQETVFGEAAFHRAADVASRRASLYNQDITIDHDLFAPIPGMEKKQ